MLRSFTTSSLRAVLCLTLVLITLLATIAGENNAPAHLQEKLVFRTEKVPMRDGARLSTDIFLPSGDGRFPVILLRTPYSVLGKIEPNKFVRDTVALGYAFVVQDCRGTGDSEGKWEPGIHERQDGMDMQKWLLTQAWCNGQIATAGGSYLGYTQWAVAPGADDSLKAMCTTVPAFDWYEFAYVGGALRMRDVMFWSTLMCRPRRGQKFPIDIELGRLKEWRAWNDAYRYLPLCTWDERVGVEIPWLRDWVAHPEFDEYWARYRITDRLDEVSVPNLTITGWYDLFLDQALSHVPKLRKKAPTQTARRHQHLIIGPWGHTPNEAIGELTFGAKSKIDMIRLRDQWFGHWLKGRATGLNQWPFLRIFVMGDNCWRNENEWPLERREDTPYYFHSDGSANTWDGDGKLSEDEPGTEPADHYVYDPENPVPTHGGDGCFLPPWGPCDQREIERRADVLVYTSEELTRPLEVTGMVKVVLHAASSAPDTDWTAKLVDVHPDGRAFNLCDGIIRARYRESRKKPKLLTPNEVYSYEIDLWATSNVFRRGHRIRVEISSSNFPRFDRNPNTGRPFGADAKLRKANQTVYHDKERPSHIMLPIIPRERPRGLQVSKLDPGTN